MISLFIHRVGGGAGDGVEIEKKKKNVGHQRREHRRKKIVCVSCAQKNKSQRKILLS